MSTKARKCTGKGRKNVCGEFWLFGIDEEEN